MKQDAYETVSGYKMACVLCGCVFTYTSSDVIICVNTKIPYINCFKCNVSQIPYHMPILIHKPQGRLGEPWSG